MYEEEFISDFQRDNLKKIFEAYDKDKDGYLNLNELNNVMKFIGQETKEEELKIVVKQINEEYNCNSKVDDKLDLCDFITLMSKTSPDYESQREVINAFKIFDKDKTGYINIEEFRHIMRAIGENSDLSEIDEMLSLATVDQDGNMNYEKFVKDTVIN